MHNLSFQMKHNNEKVITGNNFHWEKYYYRAYRDKERNILDEKFQNMFKHFVFN